MEKIKITREMIPSVEHVTIDIGNGQTLTVKKHIPYDEKEAFAYEYALYKNVEDTQNEIMYDNYQMHLIRVVLVAKYYTNIDISQMVDEADWRVLYDWMTFNSILSTIDEAIMDDYIYVEQMAQSILKSMRNIYVRDHSLQRNIMKSFGFLFSGQDLTQLISKSSAVNNDMVSLIDAKKKVEQQSAKKNNKMTLDGGAVVNLAKKRTERKKE